MVLGLHSSGHLGDLRGDGGSDRQLCLGGRVRRRCLTLAPTQYLKTVSCSSGEKIPSVSSAPMDSLSKSNSEISVRILMASSIERLAKVGMNSSDPIGVPRTAWPVQVICPSWQVEASRRVSCEQVRAEARL